jgi:hypothetical protein
VATPAARRQSVQMLEDFARLAAEPKGEAMRASVRISERTQGFVDAVFAQLQVM